jgi:excinuclease UvrABC nuclease subunit
MKIKELIPCPVLCESFKRNRERFIPELSGCYALATFENVVLYIGLTKNLRRRMNEHLDSEEKTTLTINGRAVFFYWLEVKEINKVERTWLNTHLQHEGVLPVLNKVYSPISA